jgi:hypothetical protein
VILDTANVLARALPEGDTSYARLRFIDRYGDTTFDRSQIPLLIQEIGRLRDGASNDVLEILDGVERLAQQALAEPHAYLTFIGD